MRSLSSMRRRLSHANVRQVPGHAHDAIPDARAAIDWLCRVLGFSRHLGRARRRRRHCTCSAHPRRRHDAVMTATMTGDPAMTCKLRRAAVLALLLANGACATSPAEPVFEPDPVLHPPVGRIVFTACVQTKIRTGSRRTLGWSRRRPSARGGGGAGGIPGNGRQDRPYRRADTATEAGRGEGVANADYTIRIEARSARVVVKGRKVGSYDDDTTGKERFSTDEAGTADGSRSWSPRTKTRTRVASTLWTGAGHQGPGSRGGGTADEFDLALMLQNEANGQTLELSGPRVRIPERIWAMNPPLQISTGADAESEPGRRIVQHPGTGLEVPQVHRREKDRERFLGSYAGAARGDDE